MGSRKWEVGSEKSEVGSRKWEVGSRKAPPGFRTVRYPAIFFLSDPNDFRRTMAVELSKTKNWGHFTKS